MSGLDLLLSQRHLVIMLLWAGGVGVGLGVVYDLLAILRLVLMGGHELPSSAGRRVGRVLRFFGDLLFVLTAALALILLAYYTNDGRLRAPAIFGTVAGFVAWRRTLGRLLMFLVNRFLFRLVRLCGRILAAPCRVLWRFLRWLLRPVVKLAKRLVFSLRRLLARRKPTEETHDAETGESPAENV